MLIPKIYVTKLIGVKGCMIKKLSHSSGGAMIKILSEKNREDFAHEIIVSLGGGIGQIQDAACLIIEQIECFKNGGPVYFSLLNRSLRQESLFIKTLLNNSRNPLLSMIKKRKMTYRSILKKEGDPGQEVFPLKKKIKRQSKRKKLLFMIIIIINRLKQ